LSLASPSSVHLAGAFRALYTRCLICATPFEENEALEHLPKGKRVAYDPDRGRLWIICRGCRRWSLVPLEARWEALEELEKLVRDRSRLLSQTDNIALLRAGPLEIVRVGRSDRNEEAWWRYGKELRDRRATAGKLSLAGSVAAGAFIFMGPWTGGMGLFGMWVLLSHAPDSVTQAARWLRFGQTAWRGSHECARCGHAFRALLYRDRGSVHLRPDAEGGTLAVALRCPVCGDHEEGGMALHGAAAERTLRRVLAYQHFGGASERRIRSATRLIEEAGSAGGLTRIVVQGGRRLVDIRRTGAIALEIAASETAEQRLLELELADLERLWREEERLAEIIDGELTPLPLLEALRRKVSGQP
jgi:hypothetical protein